MAYLDLVLIRCICSGKCTLSPDEKTLILSVYLKKSNIELFFLTFSEKVLIISFTVSAHDINGMVKVRERSCLL